MSRTINLRGGVTLTAAYIKCERCEVGTGPHFQITGPNGYVQICYVCLGMIDQYAHLTVLQRDRDSSDETEKEPD